MELEDDHIHPYVDGAETAEQESEEAGEDGATEAVPSRHE